ncbi:hypothetical protein SLE2022_267640 [Rubroshorea leprosula]
MNTGDSALLVPLPQSMERLIQQICLDQNQAPLELEARRKLASVPEPVGLSILNHIAQTKIKKTFTGFVIWKVNHYHLSNGGSPTNHPSPSSHSPVTKPVPLMDSQGGDDTPVQQQQQQRQYLPANPSPQSPFASPRQQPSQNRSTGSRVYAPEEGTTSPVGGQQRGSPPSPPKVTSMAEREERFSPQLEALGELEFRKAFLILNYIGSNKLEDVTSADQIRSLKYLRMIDFEETVWNSLGRVNVPATDRCKSLDWESGKTHLYHCHVSVDGKYKFKGPYLDGTRTHLQRVLGDDNVLMVKFAEDDLNAKNFATKDYFPLYSRVESEGIPVGLRLYRFFVFKDGGKEAKKKDPTTSQVRCFFVRMQSGAFVDKNQDYVLSGKTVREARSIFMHVDTLPNLAKYMARFSLILSKTVKLEIDLAKVTVNEIDDIYCQDKDGNYVLDKDGKRCVHTDGTGFISKDLALKCPKNVNHGNCPNNENIEEKLLDIMQPDSHNMEPPLLIQFRLFNNGSAVKGTLLVNNQLPEKTIQIRRSMIKVQADAKSSTCTKNSLEVVSTSNQPRKASLSKNLIALLSCGGVPQEFFMGILQNALDDANRIFSSKRAALKVALNCGWMDDLIAARMILSGIPLNESHLQDRLSMMSTEEKKSIKGGKLPLNDCYYLMGTADPTGILEPGEVSVILENGQISGEVLVYRNPGLHWGDTHKLKAKYIEELEDFVGNAKYAIFFPCKGPRSLTDEMAGGDLDGDRYFVSKNPQLLHYFKDSERWTPSSSTLNVNVSGKMPSELSARELEVELFKLFLRIRFHPSFSAGVAAYSWMAIMDRFLSLQDNGFGEKAAMKKNMLRLINIYYDALDAPKRAEIEIEVPKELKADVFPHHMGKTDSFKSTSILGRIFDQVGSHREEESTKKEVQKLPCFEVYTPEVEAFKMKWNELYKQYREDMRNALQFNVERDQKQEAADLVISKYKQILYDAAEFEQSERPLKDIYDEALAIYNVVYDYVIECMENDRATDDGDVGAAQSNNRDHVGKCAFVWKVAGPALCKFYATELGEKLICCVPSVLKELFS